MTDIIESECKKIDVLMDTLIQCDILDEAFCGFVKNRPDADLYSDNVIETELINTLQNLSSETVDEVFKFYVNRLSTISNFNHSQIFFNLLETAMKKELFTPKKVCDYILLILTSQNFEFQNEVFWVNGLNFTYQIIFLVNYKGVRDILAILLSKVPLIPLTSTASSCPQVTSLYILLKYIFDRNEALLPGYFVLDEIYKKVAWNEGHWKFSKLISAFVDTFRPLAKMVSISGRPKIFPIVGTLSLNFLKLEYSTAKYRFKGLLPYDKEIHEPQLKLLLFIMEQMNSKEAIVNSLSLNKAKGRSTILESLIIKLIVKAITKCGNLKLADNQSFRNFDFADTDNEFGHVFSLWQHISSTALYFEFFYQNIHFSCFLVDLLEKICKKFGNHNQPNIFLMRSRELFMWTLLQMLCESIQKGPDSERQCNLVPIFKFFEIFYPDKEPIPLPDLNKPNCIYIMSAASIWTLLAKKAENDSIKLQRSVPIALKLHVEFLQEMINNTSLNSSNDFIIVLLCNSYFTNNECYTRAFRMFIENVLNGNRNSNPASSALISNNQTPIPINLLDSLSVHTKINLVNHIMNQFNNWATSKAILNLPSGVVETISRLMAYTEIEAFGIKNFINQLLPNVLRNNCWNFLYTLLELFSYRLHHVNCAYRIQLLRQICTKSNIAQINNVQLYSCIESTTLKIILGLNSTEFLTLPALIQHRVMSESLNFLPPDSEELIKIFVLTLARAFHITGSETLSTTWVNEILTGIKNNLNINLTWPEFTLKCFPSVINKFYQENGKSKELNKDQLQQHNYKLLVDEEYRKWKSMTNEGDMIKHFTSQGTPPFFFCILYKMLLDNEPITLVVYKIIDRIGVRAQSIQLRTFADFLVYEFSSLDGNRLNKFLDALNELIWKCYIISFDRLLLCLALRSFEGNEAQVCFFIVQYLCHKNPEFQNRLNEFVKENSPEHWKQSNWAEKHALFQRKFPDKYYFDHLQDSNNQGSNTTYLPVMFSNVCLRVLPVFDIIIHRLIELPSNHLSNGAVDGLLDQHGCLYKFHNQPITFLYNTLHYYENNLRKKFSLKRKLVSTIVNAFKDIRPRNWAVTETFLNFCQKNEGHSSEDWNPGHDYYKQLIGRLVDTLCSNSNCPFQPIDYRFNEFPNAASHALYVTCVEILALPGEPSEIAGSIINIVLNNHRSVPREDIELWINAIAMILTSLPDSYSDVINDRIIALLKNPPALDNKNIFYLVDFKNSHLYINESEISYLIALSHAYWSHGSIGQICSLSLFLKEKIKPIIETEEQFLFVCYLVGPFLHRFFTERTRCVMDIAIELYEMLEIIDKKCDKLNHIDTICDFLYHIKYMFTGDHIKTNIEKPIVNMRQELKKKLRFMLGTINPAEQS